MKDYVWAPASIAIATGFESERLFQLSFTLACSLVFGVFIWTFLKD